MSEQPEQPQNAETVVNDEAGRDVNQDARENAEQQPAPEPEDNPGQ